MTRVLRSLVLVVIAALSISGVSYALTGNVAPSLEDGVQVEVTLDDDTAPTAPSDDVAAEPDVVADVTDGVAEGEGEGDDEQATHVKERSTEGCPEGFTGNHGQFVSQSEERPRSEAAHSECGKSVHADELDQPDGDDDADDTDDPKVKKEKTHENHGRGHAKHGEDD